MIRHRALTLIVGASFALAVPLFTGFFVNSQPAAAADARLAAIRARALPAAFDSAAALTAELSRDMRLAGPSAGAYVADLDSHRTLFSYKGDVARSPASTEKLYTTSAALARFGPAGLVPTTVLRPRAPGPSGGIRGDLQPRRAGGPTV